MNMIGEKVKLLLNKNGMTAKDLSVATKIPNTTLADLLKGRTKNLSIQNAQKICTVLNCTLDYLVDDSVATETIAAIKQAVPTLTIREKKVLRRFGELNEVGQDYLLETARILKLSKKYRKEDNPV